MCRSHATVRELMARLVEEVTELMVTDLEAGLEDFSRGTPRHADSLLVVAEPYYKSLETGRRIADLAHELGVPRILGVANKVRSKGEEAAIHQFAQAHQLDLAAVVPQDEGVLEAERRGCSPVDLVPEAAAVRAIRALASSL
jgi:CO dehydrogenase maturation factor